MVQLPRLDQLPTYSEVAERIHVREHQCMWVIPKTGERCKNNITEKEIDHTFKLVHAIRREKAVEPVPEALLQLVRHSCCNQFHRDVVRNHGVDKQLAKRWEDEIADDILQSIDAAAKSTVDTDVVQQSHAVTSSQGQLTLCLKIEEIVAETPIDREVEEASDEITILLADMTLEDDNVSMFRLQVKLPGENVASKLLLNLSSSQIKKQASKPNGGFIYLFSQARIPGMVKIGFTYETISSRLSDWSKCGHGYPILLRGFERVPYTERVETLIHFELLTQWRRERYCKSHGTSHVEWFKVDGQEAVRVAETWVQWMKQAQPYDYRGDLRQPWVSTIQTWQQNGIGITGQMLLDMVGAQRLIEDSERIRSPQSSNLQCNLVKIRGYEMHAPHPQPSAQHVVFS